MACKVKNDHIFVSLVAAKLMPPCFGHAADEKRNTNFVEIFVAQQFQTHTPSPKKTAQNIIYCRSVQDIKCFFSPSKLSHKNTLRNC